MGSQQENSYSIILLIVYSINNKTRVNLHYVQKNNRSNKKNREEKIQNSFNDQHKERRMSQLDLVLSFTKKKFRLFVISYFRAK